MKWIVKMWNNIKTFLMFGYGKPGKYAHLSDMKALIIVILTEYPKLTNKQIGRKIGRSAGMVSRYTNELMLEHKIKMFTKPGRHLPYYFRLATPIEQLETTTVILRTRNYSGPRSETGKIIQDRIVDLICQYENLTIEDIAKKLDMKYTVVYNYMQQLTKANLVVKMFVEGSKKAHKYMAAPKTIQAQPVQEAPISTAMQAQG